ncbi:hypothetical protein OCU04_010807 [Sclerotinia nivalis]|uniref:Uncharacterized protein n=1 Tax=Sclerotinia nivalis TaxID=352851 RepID=A0A9X0ACU4_9HELO|nr:hypothetical protein OCU04_010807 [Sclerotinia nivalis]
MTTAQLERVLQRTPQMTRFNPSRRSLQALKAPDSRTSKSEIVTTSDEVVTAPNLTPIVHSPISLTGEDLGNARNETSAAVRADDAQGSVLKSTDSIRPPCHEDISRSKQQGGTFPKRFLKTIAKRKQLRGGKHKESKVTTLLPVEETLNTFFHGEKGDEHADFSSRESGGMVKVDTPAIISEPSSGETSGDSQESTNLEEIIRTAPRTSTSQAMNDFRPHYVSLSFGPARLVRRANMSSDNEGDDSDDDLNDLEVAILGLGDSNDSFKSMPGPDDSNGANIHHKSRNGRLNSQKQKKEKKMPRRLPVDELYLVSERVEEPTQENDDESVRSLGELPDDPISQDASDALQVINTVGRTKRDLNTLHRWSYGAFGKIDTREFRFPKLESTSPQAKTDNRHEVRPSHSDGFVGSEANFTGQFMMVPKQKRVNISIWGLTTRVAQLQLVREKDYGLVEESNGQIKRRNSARKSKRPPNKQAKLDAPVFTEPKAQAVETGDAQQNDQDNQNHQDHDDNQKDRPMNGYLPDDRIIPNVENNSPSPLNPKVCRKVTFDEGVDVDQRARMHSSDSLVRQDMETTCSESCHRGECEEDGLSWQESERRVVSISSDDDDPEESDESSDNSSEEMNEEQQMEGDSDAQTTSGEDMDSQSDATSISVAEELSEVSENRENSENSDEEMDEEGEEEEEEEEEGEYSTVQAVLEEKINKQVDEGGISTENPSEVGEPTSKEGDHRNNFHDSDEEVDLHKQLRGGEEITTVPLLGRSNQHKESSPFEDLLLKESQTTEAGANEENDDSQPSHLSVAMSWQNTAYAMSIPEADTWRPRKPKPSSVMNETGEDIVDSPSPVSAIVIRRRSTGLQTHRRRIFSSRPLALTTSRSANPPGLEVEETQVMIPEIPETQFTTAREVSIELGRSQVTDLSSELENSIIDALPPDDQENFLPHFSQLSFIPEDIPEESYFYRASQSLMGNFGTPKSRAKSTPARFYPEYNQAIVTPASIQPSTETTVSVFSGPRTSPKFSQQSYQPTPRPEKSLSRLTRQASFAFGTLPVSARKRTKTLPFVPPFKKPTLQI